MTMKILLSSSSSNFPAVTKHNHSIRIRGDFTDLMEVNTSQVKKHEKPDEFVPGNYCVLCGRGKEYFDSIGNRRFRVIVSMYLEKYKKAETKAKKSRIVSDVVDIVRSSGGAFLKLENGKWWEVGDNVAREKVGAQFRDFLHDQYRSAGKSKAARRRSYDDKKSDTSSDKGKGRQLDKSQATSDPSAYKETSSSNSSASFGQHQPTNFSNQTFPFFNMSSIAASLETDQQITSSISLPDPSSLSRNHNMESYPLDFDVTPLPFHSTSTMSTGAYMQHVNEINEGCHTSDNVESDQRQGQKGSPGSGSSLDPRGYSTF